MAGHSTKRCKLFSQPFPEPDTAVEDTCDCSKKMGRQKFELQPPRDLILAVEEQRKQGSPVAGAGTGGGGLACRTLSCEGRPFIRLFFQARDVTDLLLASLAGRRYRVTWIFLRATPTLHHTTTQTSA